MVSVKASRRAGRTSAKNRAKDWNKTWREWLTARLKEAKANQCQCVYCRGDVEELAELAMNYEMDLDWARQKLEAAEKLLANAGVENPRAAIQCAVMRG